MIFLIPVRHYICVVEIIEVIPNTILNFKKEDYEKNYPFTACALLCAGTALSQNYKHAIGLRAGGSNAALTYKQHLNAGNAFEVMAWFGFYEASSFSAAGLYEWTQPVINNDFNLYYGVGGHLGAAANKFAIGIDAIVGLEYKIPNAPIAFSLDYKPSVNFMNLNAYGLFDLALGIKFTF